MDLSTWSVKAREADVSEVMPNTLPISQEPLKREARRRNVKFCWALWSRLVIPATSEAESEEKAQSQPRCLHKPMCQNKSQMGTGSPSQW